MIYVFFYRKKNILTFFFLISISIFFIATDSQPFKRTLNEGFQTLVFPLAWIFVKTREFFVSTLDGVLAFHERQSTLKGLELRIEQEKNSLLDSQVLLEENRRLKEQLGYIQNLKEKKEFLAKEILSAQVILRDPLNFYNSITLNKGHYHGLTEHMPVFALQKNLQKKKSSISNSEESSLERVVVGKIIEISYLTSKVLLLTHLHFWVHARVQDSEYMGFIQGKGPYPGSLSLKYIDERANIQLGSKVVSSGGRSLFPFGIQIGTIQKKIPSSSDATQEFSVLPAVDFSRLNYVFVLKGNRMKFFKTLWEKPK